jgi:hypothetical protein
MARIVSAGMSALLPLSEGELTVPTQRRQRTLRGHRWGSFFDGIPHYKRAVRAKVCAIGEG